jgi:hypothetical protein
VSEGIEAPSMPKGAKHARKPKFRGFRQSQKQIIWISHGWQWVNIGFCPSKAAWLRFVKEEQIKDRPYPNYEGSVAASTLRCSVVGRKENLYVAVICLSDELDKKYKTNPVLVTSVIVHEVMHVWQSVLIHMQEHEPGEEFEAYGVQFIFYEILNAYLDSRIRRK